MDSISPRLDLIFDENIRFPISPRQDMNLRKIPIESVTEAIRFLSPKQKAKLLRLNKNIYGEEKRKKLSSQYKLEQLKLNNDLFYAIDNNDLKEVKKLIEVGADINYTTNYYEDHEDTPLTLALTIGNSKMIQYLLEHGADPFVNFKRVSPLNDYPVSTKIGKLLLKYGVDPNYALYVNNIYPLSPFEKAILYEPIQNIKLLIKYGADIHGKDKFQTPLYYAINRIELTDKDEIIKLLQDLLTLDEGIQKRKAGLKTIVDNLSKPRKKLTPNEQELLNEYYEHYKQLYDYVDETKYTSEKEAKEIITLLNQEIRNFAFDKNLIQLLR